MKCIGLSLVFLSNKFTHTLSVAGEAVNAYIVGVVKIHFDVFVAPTYTPPICMIVMNSGKMHSSLLLSGLATKAEVDIS